MLENLLKGDFHVMGPLIKITILVFCFCPSIEWRLYSVFCGDIEAVFLLDNEASGKIIANNYRTRQYAPIGRMQKIASGFSFSRVDAFAQKPIVFPPMFTYLLYLSLTFHNKSFPTQLYK